MKLKNFMIIIMIYTVPQCLNGAEAVKTASAALTEIGKVAREHYEAVKKAKEQHPSDLHISQEFVTAAATLTIVRAINFAKQEILSKIDALKTQLSQSHKE